MGAEVDAVPATGVRGTFGSEEGFSGISLIC